MNKHYREPDLWKLCSLRIHLHFFTISLTCKWVFGPYLYDKIGLIAIWHLVLTIFIWTLRNWVLTRCHTFLSTWGKTYYSWSSSGCYQEHAHYFSLNMETYMLKRYFFHHLEMLTSPWGYSASSCVNTGNKYRLRQVKKCGPQHLWCKQLNARSICAFM